ncbi:MAG TPA: MBL fold metallo-hydrolase [Opitutaceae bacterium]|jgi:glyoxylase-like metal-dependent hydrolase (beta-lactamase superfamily II)
MTRRQFLRSSLAASAAAAAGARMASQSAPAQAARAATSFTPLRRGVGIFTGRGGTIGWLSNPDALAVVDTQFPDTAAACLKGIPGIGSRTIDVTLNTHHHLDHTAGNVVFKAASTELVAQAAVPKLQFDAAQRAEQKEGRVDPEAMVSAQVYADTTFTDVWRREIGSEIVTAEFRGPAHTGGDAVVIFEKANVVHMGDLVFNRIYPYVDRPGGASIRGWVKSLGDCAAAYPADAIYVFGHGSAKFGVTGTRQDLLVMRDFFTAVLERVQKQVAAGADKPSVVGTDNLPGFPDFSVPLPNRLGMVLGAAFDELTAPGA